MGNTSKRNQELIHEKNYFKLSLRSLKIKREKH